MPSMSWFTSHHPLVAVVFALKSCAVSGFTFLLWITAKTFGSMPTCNSNAFIFLFVPIHILKHGCIISLVLAGLGALGAALFVFGLSIFVLDFFRCGCRSKAWNAQARWAFGAQILSCSHYTTFRKLIWTPSRVFGRYR